MSPKLFLLAVLLPLAACGVTSELFAKSKLVRKPGASGSAYAPVNEKSLTGLVSYDNSGFKSATKGRREDAYKRMHDACGGDYRIVSESIQQELQPTEKKDGKSSVSTTPFVYIEFDCVEK